MFEDFATWSFISSFIGASTITAIIVQITKNWIDTRWHIPTQLYSYLVALVVLMVSFAFTNQLTVSSGVLLLINALLVSIASNGAHDGLKRILAKKGEE